MKTKTKSGLKIISHNRKAKFNYFFTEFFEAGIVLKGSEIKSLRDGKVNIAESYAYDLNGEIYCFNNSDKFKINLEYQIFTNNVVAKPAFITADYYRLIDPNNPKKSSRMDRAKKHTRISFLFALTFLPSL